MRAVLASFLGRRPAFEGTASEERVYEVACRLWRAAGYRVKGERFISPTLGARVTRTRGFSRRAAA